MNDTPPMKAQIQQPSSPTLSRTTCSMLGRTFFADSSKGKVLVRFIPRASDFRMEERTDKFNQPEKTI